MIGNHYQGMSALMERHTKETEMSLPPHLQYNPYTNRLYCSIHMLSNGDECICMRMYLTPGLPYHPYDDYINTLTQKFNEPINHGKITAAEVIAIALKNLIKEEDEILLLLPPIGD